MTIALGTKLLLLLDRVMDRASVRFQVEKSAPGRFDFLEAESVDQGIKLLQMSRVDCVLLDLDLDEGNGLRFFTECLSQFGNLYWPVLILTDCRDHLKAVKAMKMGASEFLDKTRTDSGSLLRAIQNQIDRTHPEREFGEDIHDLRRQIDHLQKQNQALLQDLRDKSDELERLWDKMNLFFENDSPENASLLRNL